MAPVDIAYSPTDNTLAITWDDGARSLLPIAYLRSWCPCAQCQGHGDVVRRLDTPDTITALEIHEMGAYAIAIRFSDGHDAGIFSWQWLRALAPESAPVGLKQGAYRRGSFAVSP